MPQPFNYIQNQPDINSQILKALQIGQAVREVRAQNAQAEEAEQYKGELQTALSSNDPKAFITLAAKYPALFTAEEHSLINQNLQTYKLAQGDTRIAQENTKLGLQQNKDIVDIDSKAFKGRYKILTICTPN